MKDFEHRIRDRDITLFGVPKPVPDVTWATFVMPLFTLFLFISGLAVLSTIHFREKIEAQARTFLAVPISGSFTHKVVRASFIWDSFEIRGIQYFPKDAQDPVRIKRVIVSEIGRKFLFKVARNGLLVPDKFKLGIVGLQTSVSNFPPETAQFLRELGYESVYLSLSAEVIMSRASERMELRKVVADVSDAGRFVFTMTLDHISIPRDMDSIASVFQISKLLESPEWQSALVTSLDFEFRNQT
ncbi:MAG TPA: hypothetical protein VM432_10835, partial [Bdellovibrionales bacterium]|nr:hypothetical protein [Bdellovibrionales bacterium]